MGAITVDAIREHKEITGLNTTSFPVAASTRIYMGTIVGLNSSGYLISGVDTSAMVFVVGISMVGADNSASGTNGKISCRVYTRGDHKLTLTSVAVTDVGKYAFVADNDTVSLTATTWKCLGKITQFVSSNTCFIDIGDRIDVEQKTMNIQLRTFLDNAFDPLGGGAQTETVEIPLQRFKKNDLITPLPSGGDTTNLGLVAGTHGSASYVLKGTDAGNSGVATKTETARIVIPIPEEYIPGTDLTIGVHAGMLTTVSSDVATVDLQVYEGDEEAGIGSDLCTTAAQDINSVTLATQNFTINGADLTGGDMLDIEVTCVVTDSNDAGAMFAIIGAINLTYITELTEGDGTYMAFIPGTHGSASPVLIGRDAGGTTETATCRMLQTVPENYIGGDITLRVAADMQTTVSDGTATLDAQVYEGDGDGGVGSDLCTTAAQSINNMTVSDKDFNIDGDGLSAGDILDIELTTAVTDSGDAGVMRAKITDVKLLYWAHK